MATLKKQSVKLPRAPLIFVLAQVRFNPVLKMESYVPDIQEYLRHHEFPRYRLENIQNIMIGTDTKISGARGSFTDCFSSVAIITSYPGYPRDSYRKYFPIVSAIVDNFTRYFTQRQTLFMNNSYILIIYS